MQKHKLATIGDKKKLHLYKTIPTIMIQNY